MRSEVVCSEALEGEESGGADREKKELWNSHPRQVEKEENMKGKYRYSITIAEDSEMTVSEIFDQLPIRSITEDENGRKHEIKTPLVSHNGRHVIKKDIGRDYGIMYYNDLPVSKVIVSEYEYRIFLKKRKNNEKTGRYGGCIERERATA